MKIPCGKSVFLIHILASISFVSAQSLPVSEQAFSKVGTAAVDTKVSSSEPAKKSDSISFDRPDLTRVGVQPSRIVSLTLDEAIRRALQNNNNIELSRDDVRFQETQVRSILGSYDPVFTVVPTYTRNSTTGSQATSDFSANSSVDQLLRTGGKYTAFFNNFRTENAFTQAQVSSGSPLATGTSAIYSSSLGFRYTQPLLRNLKVDSTRRNLRIAQRRLEQTDADFRTQAIDTIARVQRAYWDLVFALRDQQNRVANLNLAQENLRQVEARIAAGAAAPLARAEVATEMANRESDVLIATQQVGIAENAIKQLVLREAIANEWAEAWVPTDQPTLSAAPINLDEAIKDAMDNRWELRRLKYSQDINAIDIDYFRNQTKPQIDLNTTFSLDGFAQGGSNEPINTNLFTSQGDLALLNGINQVRVLPTIGLAPVPNPAITIPARPEFLFGSFGRSMANMFRSDAPNYSVGVTISFPFRNRTAKANLAGALVQKNQLDTQVRSQEQVVIVEVRNAVQAVETARQRILASRRARVNAEIQLEGERRLYDSGRSTTFILFQRENALANARNAEIRAETDYSKAVADLQRSTSTTLRINNIDVASPTKDK
jgi:HAE1 family hydrophobic/amphiphilic exporter-1